ncbi:hypothetical protein SAMN05428979_1682 [Stappia sp. ES.058]|nr:hypothetical protein SAMN05428979_1682 [Stappia sp. ES.058]
MEWKVFVSGQGARLTATSVRSFLGSDEVSRSIRFSALCNPQQPVPYLTSAVALRDRNATVPARHELRIVMENNGYISVVGDLDRIATANARDNVTRYSFPLPAVSIFFDLLTRSNSRIYPIINAGSLGAGTRLRIRESDRAKVSQFVQACQRFGPQGAAQQRSNATRPNACRDYLNGPNPYNNNEARTYSPEVVSRVCGDLRMDVRPAACMHYVMSGRVPWNRQGGTNWRPGNAADLCRESRSPDSRLSCFGRQINSGATYSAAIEVCRGT